ncbi:MULTISPECIES: MbeD/MobD family mobilization/exclusion protein [Musicola]|uniref:Uncharacterized protein n=1 Tax=Musicola paradisiaca (strain Ech703) TaxID=579405 RepID=C6CE47_MUSP7|nr:MULTISPECIES: MbeD/MobD family mobilization/exclusion protein [Musicola]ACS87141.1 conserved hypothetical protein [Musicola paradisiaca Ech703]
MCIEEWETRLENALLSLEESVRRQQQNWRQDYQRLHLQLAQAQQREADLCARINELVTRVNLMDDSPERNPLLQKVNLIRAHLDALAKEAAAFKRSLP